MGHITCNSMEIGIIEGAIPLIHFDLQQKINQINFFMKLQFEEKMLWYILWEFQIREQSSF